jgi:hypothetical protein
MRTQPNTDVRVVPYKHHPSANEPAYVVIGGTDVVTNGGFGEDASWTKGTGWTIGAGVATHAAGTASYLSQVYAAPSFIDYLTVFTVSGRTAGSVRMVLGTNAGDWGTSRTANGVYAEVFSSNFGGALLGVSCSSTFDGSVDSIEIYDLYGTDPGMWNVITKASWSYDAAPTGGAIKVHGPGTGTPSGGTMWGVDVTASGKDKKRWKRGLYGNRGDGIAAVLYPGGAGVSGKLNVHAQ